MLDFTNDEDRRRLEGVMDAVAARMKDAGTPVDADLLPPQALEEMYSLAHSAYSVENYAEAETLFMGMLLFAPGDSRGWLGYAGASEAQKKWAQAVGGYAGAFDLLPEDPVPPYRSGVCLMALEDSKSARQCFATAAGLVDKVKNDPKRLAYVKRAESMLLMLGSDGGRA